MKRHATVVIVAIVACAPKHEWRAIDPGEDRCPSPGTDEGALPSTRSPVCAPVVSLRCAITLPCALATPRSDGAFDVGEKHIEAHLRRYCEGARCFPALVTRDLDCDGCGEGRSADSTCRFDRGRCVSGAH